jgi:hypothetical protein
MKPLFGAISGLILAGCASAPAVAPVPAHVVQAAPSAFAASSGMVIGTMSYHYVNVSDRGGAPVWVVHLDRLDGGAVQDYSLPVSVDDARHRGVFTGALPAGVYAFREAAAAGRHFPANAVNMPFEVQAGEVRDAGHYALNPVSADQ